MENIINQLVSYDRQARETVRRASQEKERLQLSLEEERKRVYDDCIAKARQRVEQVRDETARMSEEDFKAVQERYQQADQALEEIYQQHAQEWIKKLTDRCLAL